jgi:hypothetical protein
MQPAMSLGRRRHRSNMPLSAGHTGVLWRLGLGLSPHILSTIGQRF